MPIPLEQLCERLDIASITEVETDAFEAALVTDQCKSSGAILFAKGKSRQRRRFSIAHELGHFLIPTHSLPAGESLPCSAEHMSMLSRHEQDRRRRIEAEANRFAALLLMPPPMLRAQIRQIRAPDVTDIPRLAKLFDVSKDALARAYVDYSREAVAVIVIRNGQVLRAYRNGRNFPWISVPPGMAVPGGSIYSSRRRSPGEASTVEECDPALWLAEPDDRAVACLSEQVLEQQNGYSLLMLVAEMTDEGDD